VGSLLDLLFADVQNGGQRKRAPDAYSVRCACSIITRLPDGVITHGLDNASIWADSEDGSNLRLPFFRGPLNVATPNALGEWGHDNFIPNVEHPNSWTTSRNRALLPPTNFPETRRDGAPVRARTASPGTHLQ
jgi:hypothetical protein